MNKVVSLSTDGRFTVSVVPGTATNGYVLAQSKNSSLIYNYNKHNVEFVVPQTIAGVTVLKGTGFFCN